MNNDTCSGVTGWKVIADAAQRHGTAPEVAERIADEIYQAGYVCVPKEPTQKMIDAAWADALAEDAAAVWVDMITEAEGLTQSEEEIRKEAERLFPPRFLNSR